MSRYINFLLITLFIFIIINPQYVLATEPTDIGNHWAQDYILNLINMDIMEIYPDGTFKPEQAITRGEFTVALARQLNLLPDANNRFNDCLNYPGASMINALVERNIITGYPDNTFKPEKPISRAEMITVLVKALGINDDKLTINLDNYRPFNDISENHWACTQIKIAEKLGLVTGDNSDNFYPGKETTRAEAAKCLTKFTTLSSDTGYIADIYPASQKLSFNLLDGQRRVLKFSDNTVIGRNNRIVPVDEILKTDKVFIIANNDEEVKYIKAYGIITQDDLATEISNITNDILEPDDVKRLSGGDLGFLRPKLRTALNDQLISQGLSIEEADAIMATNWDELEILSKERLSEAIAIQTGLPLDITRSLLEGDWNKIKSYAQIEFIQRLVQEVLESDLLS